MEQAAADLDSIARARRDYENDGAAVLRGVLPPEWIKAMRIAVDRVIREPAASAVEYTEKGKSGRYVGDFFVWMRDPTFMEFVLNSPLPALAASIMGSSSARLFYDHLLVKEPQTEEETPWHQDLPYWPLKGSQILSIWVPLDPVTLETGAVQYVRGSHKFNKMYAPRAFGDKSGFAELYAKMGLEPFPDIKAVLSNHEVLSWSTEPGDVILHHPLTFHYATGNYSRTERRRAIAVRYLGDDAVYDDRPGTFMEKDTIRSGLLEPIEYRDGDALGGLNFPLAWSGEADAH